jgi:hypothetical protein
MRDVRKVGYKSRYRTQIRRIKKESRSNKPRLPLPDNDHTPCGTACLLLAQTFNSLNRLDRIKSSRAACRSEMPLRAAWTRIALNSLSVSPDRDLMNERLLNQGCE